VPIKPDDYDKKIDDMNIVGKLVYNCRIGGLPRGVLWSDYILETSIQPFQKGVTQETPTITILFKSYSPFGEDRWTIKPSDFCLTTRAHNVFQNHWTNYWDEKYNKNYINDRMRVYRFNMPWILLIKLKQTDNLEEIRYNVFGQANKSYYGGEFYSWHRYTNVPPLPVSFEHSKTHITIKSQENLDPTQWYAWVLLHTGIGGRPALYEDYIIPFLPNDCSKCREAVVTFLMIMKRKGQYMYAVGRLICKEYLWKERFSFSTLRSEVENKNKNI
jgi:hypothetical protein